MGFAEGLLRGFDVTNRAIQGWQDREERKKDREENRKWREDERDYNRNWDNKRWDHAIERERLADNRYDQQYKDQRNDADRTYGLNAAKLGIAKAESQERIKVIQSRLNEAALQKQLLERQQKQQEDYEHDMPYMQLAQQYLAQGDYQNAAKQMKEVSQKNGGALKMALENPDYGGAYIDSYNKAQDRAHRYISMGKLDEQNGFKNVKDALEFYNELLPELNVLYAPELKHNKGSMSQIGIIARQQLVGAAPAMPKSDPNGRGDVAPNKLVQIVRTWNAKGEYYDAPITEFRTGAGQDRVKTFDIREQMRYLGVRKKMAEQLLTGLMPREKPDVKSLIELTGKRVTGTDADGNPVEHNLSPEEAAGFLSQFSGGGGMLSQTADYASDMKLKQQNNAHYMELKKELAGDADAMAILEELHNNPEYSDVFSKFSKADINKQKARTIRERDLAEFKKTLEGKNYQERGRIINDEVKKRIAELNAAPVY